MFKVMCINENGWVSDKKYLWGLITIKRDEKGPKYDDTVTVVCKKYEAGLLYYELLEWPESHADGGFCSDQFVPLSEIDETEMERNYQTEKV